MSTPAPGLAPDGRTIPLRFLEALAELGRLADLFRADEITAARFVVLAGELLSRLWAADGYPQ